MTNLFCSGFSFTVAMKEEAFILLWLMTTLVIPTGKINYLLINLSIVGYCMHPYQK